MSEVMLGASNYNQQQTACLGITTPSAEMLSQLDNGLPFHAEGQAGPTWSGNICSRALALALMH